MDTPPAGPHPFIPFLNALAAQIQVWVDNGLDPSRIRSLIASHLTRPVPNWGNESFASALQLTPSTEPPTAPSLPQKELRLLRTSFDSAFASLAASGKPLIYFSMLFMLFHAFLSKKSTLFEKY